MMSSAEIVVEVVANGYIDRALRMYNVPSAYANDLYQEVALILLTIDEARLNDIAEDGKLSHFVARIVKNQYHSTTSSFYRTYRNDKTTYVSSLWDVTEED